MLLAGQITQATYGRMLSRDKDDKAFDLMSSGAGLQPGEGLQIMEIQQRKLQFLQKCVELLPRDLPLSDPSIPEQPEPPQDLLMGTSSDWPSLHPRGWGGPLPEADCIFGISRLRTFVIARRDEAEDHISSLREDTSYFRGVVLDWSEQTGTRRDCEWQEPARSSPRCFLGVCAEQYGFRCLWKLYSKGYRLQRVGRHIKPKKSPR